MFASRINEMLKAQVVANGSPEEKVNRIVNGLTTSELREIAYPVLYEAYKSRERFYKMQVEHTRVETRFRIVDGKKVEELVPVTPNIDFTPVIAPRDAAGQVRRMEVRSVEQQALRAARAAFTREQRLASFVFLKSATVAVNGSDIPWHELTAGQREDRRRALAHQKRGLDETMELLDFATKVCREYGVDTLAEAEKVDQGVAA